MTKLFRKWLNSQPSKHPLNAYEFKSFEGKYYVACDPSGKPLCAFEISDESDESDGLCESFLEILAKDQKLKFPSYTVIIESKKYKPEEVESFRVKRVSPKGHHLGILTKRQYEGFLANILGLLKKR